MGQNVRGWKNFNVYDAFIDDNSLPEVSEQVFYFFISFLFFLIELFYHVSLRSEKVSAQLQSNMEAFYIVVTVLLTGAS